MLSNQNISKRERFEQSLRRSGWDESSITYEWYKVQEYNIQFDIYRSRSNPDGYLITAISFLEMLNRGV